MNEDFFELYRNEMAKAVERAEACGANRSPLPTAEAFELLCQWTRACRERGGKLAFVGNGASATMASHFAVDFTKNAGCSALAFNDCAFLTAIGNDLGYEQAFALPVRAFLREGDLLVTISSSGNSPNVVAAIDCAKEMRAKVATFSGMTPDNASRGRGDLNFFIPARTYGMVECAHQILLHCWLDQLMDVREWAQNA